MTSLFRVGQSVLMRAREGVMAARLRTARLSPDWIILALRVSQVESKIVRPGEFLSEKNRR